MSDLPFPLPMRGRDQPSRTEVLASERLTVLRHPLASQPRHVDSEHRNPGLPIRVGHP